MTHPYVDAANALAHLHQKRYVDPVTPGDFWRSWDPLTRLLVVAAGVTFAVALWGVVVALGILGGGQG